MAVALHLADKSAFEQQRCEARRTDLLALGWLHLTETIATRALDIQRVLAATGQHRQPIQDLLVAATALEHGAVVLHYDRDFDLLAAVAGLRARWIFPAGTRPRRRRSLNGPAWRWQDGRHGPGPVA